MFPIFTLLQISSIYPTIYMIIGIEIAIAVIYYYIAKFTGANEHIKNAKDTFVNVTITVFFVILMVGTLSFIEEISKKVAEEYFTNVLNLIISPTATDYDLIILSLSLMEQGPFKCIISVRNLLYFFYGNILSSAPAQFSYKFLEGTSSKVGIYGMAVENMIAQTIYYEIIYFLLYKILVLFREVLFPFLFPVGIAIRAFKPFRGAGAFLMAFSFSFYAIFPFIYVYLIVQYPVSTNGCIGAIEELQNKCELSNPNAVVEFNLLKSLSLVKDKLFDFSYFANFEVFIRDLALAFCLFPFLAFAFSVMSTNILTTLFGGRMPEIGRGLIKFI